MFGIRAATVVLTASTLAITRLALAQQSPAPGEALQEIVVTAQKREEKLSEVPLSITALTAEAMADQGVKDVGDIARLAPGLNFQTANQLGTTNISIRGIESLVGTPTTGVYIDETPIQGLSLAGLASNTYPRVFDLDRVEVLRGPQGTLYGAGSEGGTVRFLTVAPSLDTYSGVVSAELAFTDGGDPSYEMGGAVGGPIIDGKLGFRASIWTRQDGGYVDRVSPTTGAVIDANANAADTEVGRLALLIAPADGLTITPALFFQNQHVDDKAFSFEGLPAFQSIYKIPQPVADWFLLPSLAVEYDFDQLYVKSITSYFYRQNARTDDYSYFETEAYSGGTLLNLPGHPGNVIASHLATGQRDWSEELRIGSEPGAGGSLTWVGGIFYQYTTRLYDQKITQDFNLLSEVLYGAPASIIFGEAPLGPDQRYSYIEYGRYDTKQVAAFGQADYKLTDALTGTVGLRVAHTGFSFADQQNGPDGPGAPVQFGGSNKETPVTPKFSLKYDLGPDLMVYGGATKGYRIGGANENLANEFTCRGDLRNLDESSNPLTYGSDSVWSYELGSKARLLDNHLSLDGSLFYIDWSSIQGDVFLPTCALSYTTNFGSAVSQGFDLQAEAKVLDGVTLSGTLGFADARYNKTTTIANGSQILAKAGDMIGTPEWTATLGVQYDFEAIADVDSFVRADYQFTGPYDRTGSAGVVGYDPQVRAAPAAHFVTLRGGMVMEHWKLSLFIDNLLNSSTSLLRSHDSVLATVGYRDLTFRPLTVGADVEYRF